MGLDISSAILQLYINAILVIYRKYLWLYYGLFVIVYTIPEISLTQTERIPESLTEEWIEDFPKKVSIAQERVTR